MSYTIDDLEKKTQETNIEEKLPSNNKQHKKVTKKSSTFDVVFSRICSVMISSLFIAFLIILLIKFCCIIFGL